MFFILGIVVTVLAGGAVWLFGWIPVVIFAAGLVAGAVGMYLWQDYLAAAAIGGMFGWR
jgi:hypothetical protein